MDRQYSFDRDDEDDDEFMRYYRQYRPQYSNNYGGGGSGGGSSRASSSPNFSQIGGEVGRCSSAAAVSSSSALKKSPWYHMKKKLMPKSKSLEERTRPPLRRQAAAAATTATVAATSAASSTSSSTSPLGGLTGMLSDKMTVSASSSLQGDETQSRDSGHSSGGSPDFRGLRRRRMMALAQQHQQQHQHNQPFPPHRGYQARPSYYNDGNWYRQGPLRRQWPPPSVASSSASNYDNDVSSVYSYETARDHQQQQQHYTPSIAPSVAPCAESIYEHGDTASVYGSTVNGWDGSSVYSLETARPPSQYYDAYSEVGSVASHHPPPNHFSRLESWAPSDSSPAAFHKRKLDSLREDVSGSFSFTGASNSSPLRKRPFRRDDLSDDDDDDRRSVLSSNGKLVQSSAAQTEDKVMDGGDGGGGMLLALWCDRLWLLLKLVLASASGCLLLFACLFAYRSFRCDSHRQAQFDVDRFASVMAESVFGQSIARRQVQRALRDFVAGSGASSTSVIVLAGWLGGGKTFVSSLIREAFPVAENVHTFSVPVHFARQNALQFLDDLSLHIGRSCGHSLVILDDADSASSATMGHLERFVLTLQNSRLASRSNGTLVVVTTNAGGRALNGHVAREMREKGSDGRESMEHEAAVEALLSEGASVPFHNSGLLTNHGIPVRLVPFLPLTRSHVRRCVWREISKHGLRATDVDVDKILADLEYFSEGDGADGNPLSRTGCKHVASKVDLYLGGQDLYAST